MVLVFGFGLDFSGSVIFLESMRFWISCFRRIQVSVGWPVTWWNLQYLFGSKPGMFGFGGLEMVKGLRRPFWTRQSRTLDKGWLKFENFLGG